MGTNVFYMYSNITLLIIDVTDIFNLLYLNKFILKYFLNNFQSDCTWPMKQTLTTTTKQPPVKKKYNEI